jgi:hypothetical protein
VFARGVRFGQVIAVEGEDAWAFGVGSASGGGVDVSGELGRAADQVADGGGHGRRVTGPDLGFVFSGDDISHPVGGVSHGPVSASSGGDLGCSCLLGGQVGDGVDGLAGPLLRSVETAAALDAQDLGGVREEQAVDGDDLHESLFVAAVAPVVVVVNHGDLLPGQSVELAGLAAVVGATFVQG